MTAPTATPTATSAGRPAPGRWWMILTAVLALGYLYVGALSPLPSIRWPALAGGLLVLAALGLATRSRPAAFAALVAGAIVPAAFAWWSLVLPATGLLILICGTLAVREVARGAAAFPNTTGILGSTGADVAVVTTGRPASRRHRR